jgi:hypothetical protein
MREIAAKYSEGLGAKERKREGEGARENSGSNLFNTSTHGQTIVTEPCSLSTSTTPIPLPELSAAARE